MSHTPSVPAMPAVERVNLHTAALMTARTENTVRAWLQAGAFATEEAVPTPRRQGHGHEWSIAVAALWREHAARGGLDWYPQLAERAGVVASAGAAAYVRRLRADVAALQAEVERLRAGRPRGRMGTAGARGASSAVPAAADDPRPALPATLRTVVSVAQAHGLINEGHWREEVRTGRIPTAPGGPWRSGRWECRWALDDAGRTAFGRFFARRAAWRACGEPDCPACAAAAAAR